MPKVLRADDGAVEPGANSFSIHLGPSYGLGVSLAGGLRPYSPLPGFHGTGYGAQNRWRRPFRWLTVQVAQRPRGEFANLPPRCLRSGSSTSLIGLATVNSCLRKGVELRGVMGL